MGVWHCPNLKCNNQDKLTKGEHCSKCGAEAQEFGFKESFNLFIQKDGSERLAQKNAELDKKNEEFLKEWVFDGMSDEEIREKINQNIVNLISFELTGSHTSVEWRANSFKAMIEENKIIIRQNELILRTLQKLSKH